METDDLNRYFQKKIRDAKLEYPLPEEINLQKYYDAGVLPKYELEDGEYYLGLCRNAKCSKWNSARNCFTYMRSKFGTTFPEDINHISDDDKFDLFVPFQKANEIKEEDKVE